MIWVGRAAAASCGVVVTVAADVLPLVPRTMAPSKRMPKPVKRCVALWTRGSG